MQQIQPGFTETRPWGGFSTPSFIPGVGACKLLWVSPKKRLSLQRHSHRLEHWVVLVGEVQAEINLNIVSLGRGDHVGIPAGVWHRLTNKSEEDWALVAEIQVGDSETPSIMEEDIERKEDDYGRAE